MSANADAPVVLRTIGLRKSYGRRPVLRELSLAVRAGEIYGFLGRNGAGKTTAIRVIMGMLAADGGTIELFDEVVRRPRVEHKRRIGYVSQEQHFYPWMTCRRLGRFVAGFYPTWEEGEFERLLEVMDVPGDRRVGQLSHGMQVKLALALALAHRPRLLLLDEPTAGLDPAARREFLEVVALQSHQDGRTTFFSSHIVEEVERVADRVGILDQGRLAYEGGVSELRDSVRAVALPAASAAAATQDDAGAPGAHPAADLPADFEVLEATERAGERRLVLRAPPDAWNAASFAPGSVARLSLEDIFLALAVGRVSRE
jgi:ABC-2 type transport system ATP-binding protein